MAIAEMIIPEIPEVKLFGKSNSAGIGIYRHEEKASPDGPLSDRGWKRAKQAGESLGSSPFLPDRIILDSGTIPRTIQTALGVELGILQGYKKTRREAIPQGAVYRRDPRNDLSLGTIADGKDSLFVQMYKEAMRDVEAAFATLPWYKAPFLRKAKLEQEAAGKLMLDWLRLDNKRMLLPDGTPDPHTRSAREVARLQAFFLKHELAELVRDFRTNKTTHVLKYSHENMVLLWARYFLVQEVSPKRRGKEKKRISGMEIVEKVKGKVPFRSGVHIHILKGNDGEPLLRARFNNAWYEVDTHMIETLAHELVPRRSRRSFMHSLAILHLPAKPKKAIAQHDAA